MYQSVETFQNTTIELKSLAPKVVKRYEAVANAVARLEVVRRAVLCHPELSVDSASHDNFKISRKTQLQVRSDHRGSEGSIFRLFPRQIGDQKRFHFVRATRDEVFLAEAHNPQTYRFGENNFPDVTLYSPQELVDGGDATAEHANSFVRLSDDAHHFIFKSLLVTDRTQKYL